MKYFSRILRTHTDRTKQQKRLGKFSKIRLRLLRLTVTALLAFGCSAAQAPLSIRMYNPETRQVLMCSARDPSSRADTSLLASAVESCAKNLEARGFIRED